ncbi:MAG: NAD(P)/FAD-dependent oxidoreductase [Rhodobacteraceae bacterium]|nr:NAD(P)/FAD-dependent oxidoreductase [Paracoccaceae bacterium]
MDRLEIRARLEGVNPSVLTMVLVQLTGDMELLAHYAPMLSKPGEFADTIMPVDLALLYDKLATVLAEPGHKAPVITPEQLHQMMNAFCKEQVSERYLPMLFEDLEFKIDPPAFDRASPAAKTRSKDLKVLIVGAGASGICAGIKLAEAGIAFEIIEQHSDVGGVWHENTYPDCGVDSANHLYCYSFALNHNWSRYYVKQAELKDYLRDCAVDGGVMQHIKFQQEVLRLEYNEPTAMWHCTIRDKAGAVRTEIVTVVIGATGQLNQPSIPPIKGLESFKGTQMHTARWDESYDFTGKNIAMIGTGASGIQAGPPLAKIAAQLTIYQRSAPWALPRHNYKNLVTDNVKWVLAEVPGFARWYRFMLLWAYGDAVHDALIIDPDWDGGTLTISKRNADIRTLWETYIKEELADRPDLLEKAMPDYPPFGKRALRDNDWFTTLKRDNVELHNTGICHIEPDAIIDKDGTRHPTDAIVFATGFHASRMIYPMEVVGKGGQTLRDIWGDDNPRAYLGICVPGFPNLFLTYGPNTNLAHGGSIIFQSECQVHYIIECLANLSEAGDKTMEITQEAHDEYNTVLDDALSKMVWTHQGVTNWYQNKQGRVTTNSPWPLVEYWQMTRRVEPGVFTMKKEQ